MRFPLTRPALAVVLGLAFANSGCRSETVAVQAPKRCELQIATLTVIASPHINAASNGDPRSVVVRIYQLKDDVRLENAAFDGIWKDDKKTLQDDIVKVDELTVFPNSRTELHFERDPAALTVAAVVLFREPKGRSWYYTFALPPAPGKGQCGSAAPTGADCKDGACDAGGGGAPNLSPHFAFWLDGTTVDDGADHVDELPEDARTTLVRLPASKGANAGPASGAKPAATK